MSEITNRVRQKGDGSSALSEVVDVLREKGFSPRQSGNAWSARCPAHDDRNPSLSITVGAEGRILIHCHAGCSIESVVAALGLETADLFPTSSRVLPLEIRYDVRDVNGTLVARHVRRDLPSGKKTFAWIGIDGSTGLRGIKTASLPLYRSEKARSFPPDAEVIVAEGEKATETLNAYGYCALGTVTGAAGCPGPGPLEVLRGRSVILWPDHDRPGHKHMERLARQLVKVAANVRVFDWAQAPQGGDAHDYLIADPGADARLREDLATAVSVEQWLARPQPPKEGASAETGPVPDADEAANADPTQASAAANTSQATRLVALAGSCELFHSARGESFSSFAVEDHRETHAIRSSGFRRWLRHAWYQKYKSAPPAQAMTEAIEVLDAQATYDGPELPVFTRLGEYAGVIYLDLANENWEAVAVSPFGWRVTGDVPVRFRRARGMKAIARPVPGGSIQALRPFVNVASEADFILYASWLAAALRPRGPYPVLTVQGEQGSAKSTTGRVARALVDPSEAPLRSEPREARDLMIAATNSWMQGYDNLSHLRPWLSDALCRLATGGGFATRELYTNGEEAIFDAQRPVLLNGIEEVATRSDLLDRALILNLPPIPDDQRKSEEVFWRAFEVARPGILGALLDAVSVAMRLEGAIDLHNAPRMADFAVWASACAVSFGWGPEAFRCAYADNRDSVNELALEGSPVSAALRELVAEEGDWAGTARDLYDRLPVPALEAERRRLGWPGNARALSGVLRRLAPNLRAIGIEVKFLTRRHGGKRGISIRSTGKVCVTRVTSVTESAEATDWGVSQTANASVLASPDPSLCHPEPGCVTREEAQ